EAGADVLFAPPAAEVYPEGFATTVDVAGLTETLEGAARGASHFRGVATVVTKLLCMTLPDVAYFGQKDAQQVLVIRRVVADPHTLEPRERLDRDALLVVAARIGMTRLIDNVTLSPAPRQAIDSVAAQAARRKELVTCNE